MTPLPSRCRNSGPRAHSGYRGKGSFRPETDACVIPDSLHPPHGLNGRIFGQRTCALHGSLLDHVKSRSLEWQDVGAGAIKIATDIPAYRSRPSTGTVSSGRCPGAICESTFPRWQRHSQMIDGAIALYHYLSRAARGRPAPARREAPVFELQDDRAASTASYCGKENANSVRPAVTAIYCLLPTE